MTHFQRFLKEGAQWVVAGGIGFFGYRFFYGPPPPTPAVKIPEEELVALNKARKLELDAKGLK